MTLEAWEEKVTLKLEKGGGREMPKMYLHEAEKLAKEGEALSTALPVLEKLKDACRKAREWWARAEALQKPENYPYIDTLEALIAKGRPIPIWLNPINELDRQAAHAR